MAWLTLRASEEHYRTLVENAPEAIVVLDVEKGTFVDGNSNALRLFRLSREELLRASVSHLSAAVQVGWQERRGGRTRFDRADLGWRRRSSRMGLSKFRG